MRELLQIRRQSRAAQHTREPATITIPNLIAIPSKLHLTYLPFKGFCPLMKSGCAGVTTILDLIALSWGSPLSRVFPIASLDLESTRWSLRSGGIGRGDLGWLVFSEQPDWLAGVSAAATKNAGAGGDVGGGGEATEQRMERGHLFLIRGNRQSWPEDWELRLRGSFPLRSSNQSVM